MFFVLKWGVKLWIKKNRRLKLYLSNKKSDFLKKKIKKDSCKFFSLMNWATNQMEEKFYGNYYSHPTCYLDPTFSEKD